MTFKKELKEEKEKLKEEQEKKLIHSELDKWKVWEKFMEEEEKKLKEEQEKKLIPNELDYAEGWEKFTEEKKCKEWEKEREKFMEEKKLKEEQEKKLIHSELDKWKKVWEKFMEEEEKKLKEEQEKKLKEEQEKKPISSELDCAEELDKFKKKLKEEKEKKLKEKQEKKPIPKELDYAEELDKAPSIPVEEKNARAIETIEEVKGIVSSSRELEVREVEEFYNEAIHRSMTCFAPRFGGDPYLLFELIGNYIGLRDRARLRVVCRVWNEVVSRKEVYGMFVQTGDLISFFSLKNYFPIFPDPLRFIHGKHFEGGDMVLVSSCQGILCFRTRSGYIISNHHRKYIVLPAQPTDHGKKKVVAILCHELGDDDFKLVIAFATKYNLAFDVYAKDRWFTIESSIKGPDLSFLRRDGLYHNGSAYFLSEWGSIYKFDLATGASFLLRHNALCSDILGVFQNRACTFRLDRVVAGCELVVASVKENVVHCSLKLNWARLKLSPSGCRILTCTKDHNIRILTCTKDHNIIIAIGMEIFWYKIHSGVLEPIGSLQGHGKANFVAYSCYDFNNYDKANFVAYSCYDVNEILRF